MILMRVGGLPYSAIYPPARSEKVELLPEQPNIVLAAAAVQSVLDQILVSLPEGEKRTRFYNARKAFFKNRKIPADTLIQTLDPEFCQLLRQSLDAFKETSCWQERLELVYTENLTREVQQLKTAAGIEQFQHSLLFASHDLLNQLPAFLQNQSNSFNKKERQTALSIYQYLTRAIFKTSPLSWFTTVSLWRPDRQADEMPMNSAKVSVVPNVAILPGIYEMLLQEPRFYQSLSLRLNPSFRVADSDHYTWLYFDGEQEAFQSIKISPLTQRLVQMMADETQNWQLLIERLTNEIEASPEELTVFLKELIAVGLLEWILPETGLTPSWPGNLATYLAHLPSSSLLTETAFLLQHLRVSARAIPFQSLEEAAQSQTGAKQMVSDFFEKHAQQTLPITAEQLFYEDVELTASATVTSKAIQALTSELASCWQRQKNKPLPEFRSRLFHYAENHLAFDQVVDFQSFCSSFLDAPNSAQITTATAWTGKVGALLQVYETTGQTKAVVNAMYPGGGKMFARWLHLFSAEFKDQLQNWVDPEHIQFPWQGWSNANFQPIMGRRGVLTPDGRVLQQDKNAILLTELAVKRTDAGPVLWDKKSNKQLVLNDLGLESPETKPPVMQILYHLGVPYVSSAGLLPPELSNEQIQGGWYWPRVEEGSLVLARAKWVLGCQAFLSEGSPAIQMLARQKQLKTLGVPRFFFIQNAAGRSKPQFMDLESPVAMLLFDKILRQIPAGQLLITEMLPTPDQWVVGAFPERYAAEFVVEFAV